MTDIESQIESRLNQTTYFNEVDENVLPLQSYYENMANEAIPAEMCKLFCVCIVMIIIAGVIIAGEIRGSICIYNCKN